MNWDQISGFLRHVLTFLGGFVVAKGWISPDMLPEVIGAIMTVGGLVWSFVTKTRKATVVKAAAFVNVPSIEQTRVGIERPKSPSGMRI